MVVFCYVLHLSVESSGGTGVRLISTQIVSNERICHWVERKIPIQRTSFMSWYPDILGVHINADAKIIVPYSSPV